MRSARPSWPPAAPVATAAWSSLAHRLGLVRLCLGGWRVAEVTMPRLSDTMTEGTIAKWLKHPGDEVKKGEILLEIETDKATMELEAYESGVVEKVLVDEGQTVPIGQPIMLIGDGSGATQESGASSQESGGGAATAEAAPSAPEAPGEAPS